MNNALMFSKTSDEWATPQEFYRDLYAEFRFDCDAAATRETKKAVQYFGPDHAVEGYRDALDVSPWATFQRKTFWLNCPYSKCREFIGKAAAEAKRGATVVCLVPSRTDTRWWHEYVWDATTHRPRPGVEIRFLKGRLKFGGATAGAPFPSVVVIFRPVGES